MSFSPHSTQAVQPWLAHFAANPQIIKGCWQLDGRHVGEPMTDRTSGEDAVVDLDKFYRCTLGPWHLPPSSYRHDHRDKACKLYFAESAHHSLCISYASNTRLKCVWHTRYAACCAGLRSAASCSARCLIHELALRHSRMHICVSSASINRL